MIEMQAETHVGFHFVRVLSHLKTTYVPMNFNTKITKKHSAICVLLRAVGQTWRNE
jgi:hypothetical protein